MPMTTRFTLTTVAWLALGLLMAACTTESEPPAAAKRASETTVAPTNVPPGTYGQPPIANTRPSAKPSATAVTSSLLPDLGPAPDIKNDVWLNTDQPLNLELLRGKVVLVEFWTFG